MGEAILVGRGGAGGSGSGYKLVTEIINTSKTWYVPEAKDNLFSVRIFGAGGGVTGRCGGGGGYMNNAVLNLSGVSHLSIQIGAGVMAGTGGTTSFGTYLSAAGGTAGTNNNKTAGGGSGGGGGYWGNQCGGHGYQFGGGGSGADNNKSYGGYGADGGNSNSYQSGGGGGGYGKLGRGGDGSDSGGGGGGGYGPGADASNVAGYGGGGACGKSGGSGICIIQYYA